MIDHVTIRVNDYTKSKIFYERALQPIGYTLLKEYHPGEAHIGGFGENQADFWITTDRPGTTSLHIAFGVESRKLVVSFFDAAIAAGGVDNGKPGVRPLYHPDYYGAFVLDPDGNNIEVVCRVLGCVP